MQGKFIRHMVYSLYYYRILSGLFIFSIAGLQTTLAADTTTTTRDDQTAIAISLYQHDLALIQDTRHIMLREDTNTLIWKEISTNINPQTAWISHTKHPEWLQITAQRFDLNLLTPQRLLENHTGESVTVIRSNPVTGEEHRETATVLTTNGGIILKFSDRIETGIPGRLVFSRIPDELHTEPAMTIVLNNHTDQKNKPQPLRLTYLTQGLSWHADYVLELDRQNRHAHLTGMATLTNQSGIDYTDANIQLIAGDIHQARPARIPSSRQFGKAYEAVSAMAADIETAPHFELHRYALPNKTTLRNNQNQHITFMSASAIPIEKQFILTGQTHYYSGHYRHPENKQAVDVFINFRNADGELGIPLPGGVIRAYQRDQQNNLHFVGEDNLNHTPRNGKVRLQLGRAFDVTAEKKQTDFKKIPSPDRNIRQFETTHQITLYNAKKETVTVIVREPIPGDWHMQSESQPHQKINASIAEWQIEVPAEGQTVLTYRISTKL